MSAKNNTRTRVIRVLAAALVAAFAVTAGVSCSKAGENTFTVPLTPPPPTPGQGQ